MFGIFKRAKVIREARKELENINVDIRITEESLSLNLEILEKSHNNITAGQIAIETKRLDELKTRRGKLIIAAETGVSPEEIKW